MADKQSLLKSAELLAEGADPLAAILAGSHPLMVEAFYLAAIPEWYDVALLDALRLRDDGREEGLVERLARYSFVAPLAGAPQGHPAYYIRSQERTALQRRWLAEDPAAYRAAHGRALAYWEAHPDPNPFAQAQNKVYHLLFVDFQRGIRFLLDCFRDYRNEHHLPAIERLLATARDAQSNLALLEHEMATAFQDLLTYLTARLAQLRGDWDGAAKLLAPLLARFNGLEPSLRPYLRRAQAYDLAQKGRYAQAIDSLKQALREFGRPAVAGSEWGIIEAERGYTLVALGDAYVGLATAASGRGMRWPYRGGKDPRAAGLWARLQPGLNFLVSLPLVLYLSLALGGRVWHPRFWPALIGLDWIIARLMATGASFYRRADAILERHGKAVEGLLADEKLADLYLRLGDAAGAERLCRWLLTQADCPLGPYRQARVQVMLGDALLSLGRPEEARAPLRAAQPVLDDYVDHPAEARALELLGEALLATGQDAEALLNLAAASLRYQEAERWIEATRLAEGLAAWQKGKLPVGPAGEKAAQAVQGLRLRQYPGSYRHPVLLFFRQFILASLPFVLLLVPLLTMVLDTTSALDPVMHFQPKPMLAAGGDYRPVLSLEMNQSIRVANVSRAVVSGALLQMTGLLILSYLVMSFLLGLAAIVFTPVGSVEARGQGATVYMDEEGVVVGGGAGEEPQVARLTWDQVDCHLRADVCLWGRPLEDRSAFALADGGQCLAVRGLTAWYATLHARVAGCLRQGTPLLDLDFQIFPSRLGWLYAANLMLVLLLWMVAASPDEKLVLIDLPGTSYSAVDLFPYLFLLLAAAPFWWGVCQPVRQRVYLRPRTRLPLLMLGIGLVLLAVQVVLRFRPLLTVVDLYLPLGTAGVLLTAEWALWRARVGDEQVHPIGLRLGSAAVVLLACLFLGTVMVRDVQAYHAFVQGNTLRDRAMATEDITGRRALLNRAAEAYGQAAEVGSAPVWGLDTRPAARIRFGLPSPRRFPWIAALYSRGVMEVAAGLYPQALAAFDGALADAPGNETTYASRALARLSLATRVSLDGTTEIDPAQYAAAILDLHRASNLNPQHAGYYLWLALAYHAYSQLPAAPGAAAPGRADHLAEADHYYTRALEVREGPGHGALKPAQRERALTGRGWLAYAGRRHEDALADFQAAAEADPQSYEAWLAQGYAYYALDRFKEALPVWQRAAKLDPLSPGALFALGTLHWRLGGLPGRNSCADYRQAVDYFERGAEGQNLRAQAAVDRALQYRAAAQLQYLLGSCTDRVAAYERAVANYGHAVELDPQVHYWYRKARLSYSIASLLLASEPARARDWLQRGIEDIGQAIQASPRNAVYLHDQAWMLYNAWNWAEAKGLAEQEGLLQARANLLAALALDPSDRGTGYRPNFWLGLVEPEAVAGTQTLGDSRRDAGDASGALAYYELLAHYMPEAAEGAFAAGLGYLALDDEEKALAWYREGLQRADDAGDEAGPEEALLALYLAAAGDEHLPAAGVLALFEERGIRPEVHDPLAAFQLSVAALRAGDRAEYARLANLGLELAATAGDITPTRPGAAALQAYLLQHSDVDPADIYWPLWPEWDDREPPAGLARPDLYWRFRAEFGFRLLGDRKLMLARDDVDRAAGRIMRRVAKDVELAYAIEPAEHQTWRDWFVDANIGWIYLRRGDDRAAAEDLSGALADYELASLRMQARSENAALDLSEALFKAGQMALRLGEQDRADRLYDRAFDLLDRAGDQFRLGRKVSDAIAALQALAAEEPALKDEIDGLVTELERYR